MKNNVVSDRLPKTVAIVAAGGIGSRFGGSINKQFIILAGKPVLVWSLIALESCSLIDEIIPVVHEHELTATASLVEKHAISKVLKIVPGGKKREDSVMNGLIAAGDETDIVVIHDGARPLITSELIIQVILGIDGFDGSILAVPVKDTIKSMLPGQNPPQVEKTLNRSFLWTVQTPQVFRYIKLHDAILKAKKENFSGNDDSSFIEQYGGNIRIITGNYHNIKITTLEDIYIAEAFFSLPDLLEKQINS